MSVKESLSPKGKVLTNKNDVSEFRQLKIHRVNIEEERRIGMPLKVQAKDYSNYWLNILRLRKLTLKMQLKNLKTQRVEKNSLPSLIF